jgi:hypothetical protein
MSCGFQIQKMINRDMGKYTIKNLTLQAIKEKCLTLYQRMFLESTNFVAFPEDTCY